MTTLPLRNSIPSFLIPLALAVFAFSSTVQAQLSPPPDGGYPNQNTAEGTAALFHLTTGINNTAVGSDALDSNTTGNNNTATGLNALVLNNADNNTANGANALFSNTTGSDNTANGFEALQSNRTGSDNTATGAGALQSNTTGLDNTATGVNTLLSNTTGGGNTATGVNALIENTTGANNTATGSSSLNFNTTGGFNTATGQDALFSNTSGASNTANGFQALQKNTSGIQNLASGISALQSNTIGKGNTAEGAAALAKNTTGGFNTAVGFNAGANLTTGSNNIDIDATGVAGESNTIRIGIAKQTATYIRGISGAVVASGATVMVGTDGHLGTVVSSERFKEAIKPMDKASEAILALKPVTFYYKHELDPEGIPQFGLVAEQVEKVSPDLVVRGEDRKVMTVRYEAVNAMLLNEFLKEHRKVEEQDRRLQTQETTIAQQQKQIEGLAATVQKVSDQIVLSKPAPQLVANP